MEDISRPYSPSWPCIFSEKTAGVEKPEKGMRGRGETAFWRFHLQI